MDKVQKWLEYRGQCVKENWEDAVQSYIPEDVSPVENLFFIEWQYYMTDIEPYAQYYLIIPQYKIDNYRVDFLIYFDPTGKFRDTKLNKDKTLIIEIDSYVWHGATPEQFTKEKERERKLQNDGWHIMRFSGREIYKNVEDCVNEVISYFDKILCRMPKKYR